MDHPRRDVEFHSASVVQAKVGIGERTTSHRSLRRQLCGISAQRQCKADSIQFNSSKCKLVNKQINGNSCQAWPGLALAMLIRHTELVDARFGHVTVPRQVVRPVQRCVVLWVRHSPVGPVEVCVVRHLRELNLCPEHMMHCIALHCIAVAESKHGVALLGSVARASNHVNYEFWQYHASARVREYPAYLL